MARAGKIELDRDEAFASAAVKVVAVRARELFDHTEGVLDVGEPERLHDMRVATRRLRAVLEIFASCFPRAKLRPILAEVKSLADALGARRDPDVQLQGLESVLTEFPAGDRPAVRSLVDALVADRDEANSRLATALAHVSDSDLEGQVHKLLQAAR
ncbi:MAG TPA: CHAD domain-containing protein [Solirubrobacteraceae bacterium]|jgi:CHAD domain-containing protein|nr:CHAD domain-containing protein [Solirubrobacteraceae bacterium]